MDDHGSSSMALRLVSGPMAEPDPTVLGLTVAGSSRACGRPPFAAGTVLIAVALAGPWLLRPTQPRRTYNSGMTQQLRLDPMPTTAISPSAMSMAEGSPHLLGRLTDSSAALIDRLHRAGHVERHPHPDD